MCGLGDRLNKHYKKYERVALETRNLMYKSLVYVYLRQFYQFSENRIPETTTWNRNYNNNNNIEYLSIHIVNTANHSSPDTEHRNPLFARHNVPTLEVFLNPPQQRVKLVWPVSTWIGWHLCGAAVRGSNLAIAIGWSLVNIDCLNISCIIHFKHTQLMMFFFLFLALHRMSDGVGGSHSNATRRIFSHFEHVIGILRISVMFFYQL